LHREFQRLLRRSDQRVTGDGGGRAGNFLAGDFQTGDYLVELTMMILLKDKRRKDGLGYARTFVRQLWRSRRRERRRGSRSL
jgi:hypothetical protein